MLVHLGLDRIVLYSSLGQTILPLKNIDSALPESLMNIYQKTQPDKVYVITGPGSFTHVRLGVLALQTLLLFTGGGFSLLQTDKVSFYRSLVALGHIPSFVLMYIGQRKKLWGYDFNKDSVYTPIAMNNIAERSGDYAIDMMVGDDVAPLRGKKSLHELRWAWMENVPSLLYGDKITDCKTFFTPTETLTPYYLVDPTIGSY